MSEDNRDKKVFGAIAGGLYVAVGLIQLFVGLGYGSWWTAALLIPADAVGGMILILIGAVFLFGFKELSAGINEGVAYIYVGVMLALVFTTIHLLIMGADVLEAYVIQSEDFLGWTPLDDMKPVIYLGVLPLMAAFAWKDKLSPRTLSKAGV
ncbi:MAG: hypothetical protein ACXQT3_03165 [Methermicoccaceae archaeon]